MFDCVLDRFRLATGVVLSLPALALADVRQPVDFFVMQEVHAVNVSNNVLMSPKLRGIHLRDEWQLVEPAQGTFSYDWLDGQIARAKSLDKQVTLGIYTGNNSPQWLGVSLVDGVPIPWDPGVTAAHSQMVADLGARYRNETAIVAVHVSAPATDASLEMHYPSGLVNLPMYSDSKVIDTWKAAIDAYAAAFPDTALVLDVAIVPKSSEVPANRRGIVTNAVIDYARQTLGERANFIHCSLQADTPPDALHHQTIVELGESSARIGFEMVGPSTDQQRFGGPFSQALELGEQAGARWYQVYQADVPSIPDIATGVPGDYNGNNIVDAADYVLWRNTVGSTSSLAADGNRSGVVDLGDYDVWSSHFGESAFGSSSVPITSVSATSVTLPEPASQILTVLAVIGLACRGSSGVRNRARRDG